MNRRTLLQRFLLAARVTLGAGVMESCQTVGPRLARQRPAIGFLSPAKPGAPVGAIEAFKAGLNEHGYIDGQNVTLDWVFGASHDQSNLDTLAADLVRRGVDLIVCAGNVATRAALRATDSIPIVMATVADQWNTVSSATLHIPVATSRAWPVAPPD